MKVLISGASRGIGRSLCQEGVRRGWSVQAMVRKQSDIPTGCEGHLVDVRDRPRVKAILEKLAPEIDCFLINAGVGNSLSPRRIESAEQAVEILDINTTAAVYSAYVISYEWIRRGLKGKRIAIVSSLAAGRGLPRNGVYIASKTALISFFQGFELDVAKHGIEISVILPGFIDTDMTKDLLKRPYLMTAEQAAQTILNGLEQGKRIIAFPKSLVWIARIRDSLPYGLFRWIVIQLQKRKIV